MSRLTFEEYCNEPAFPVPVVGLRRYKGGDILKIDDIFHVVPDFLGLTRLEYFTAKAMQGFIGMPVDRLSLTDRGKPLGELATEYAKSVLHYLYSARYGKDDDD